MVPTDGAVHTATPHAPTQAPSMKDMSGQKALLMFSEVCLKWVNSLFRYTLPLPRTLCRKARDAGTHCHLSDGAPPPTGTE